MHLPFPPLTLAALFDFNLQPHMIGLVIPIVGLIFGGAIAICGMYFSNRRREMWHETARVALEKGQPLPPLPDAETDATTHSNPHRNDVRSGLILIAVGAGLFAFFYGLNARPVAMVGAIPGFIGIALLLFGLFSTPKPMNTDRPPQS
jgi:hypothetical protein